MEILLGLLGPAAEFCSFYPDLAWAKTGMNIIKPYPTLH